jgi:hypothetical protein
MIERLRDLFLFYVASPEQQSEKLTNIELVSCPIRMVMCNVHLTEINTSLMQAEAHRKEKDYASSIQLLRKAFEKSNDLLNHPCRFCAQHYRFKIYESLEYIHDELAKKSKGFFSKRSYKTSYSEAKDTLRQFEEEGVNQKMHLNNSTRHFLGNYLN